VDAERPLAWIAARCAALAGVVLLAAVPVYLWVEPSWRSLVARVASALVLGVALLELRRALAGRLHDSGAFALDSARGLRRPEPGIPYQFLQVANDVRAALRSRHHFDKVLWPRLAALVSFPLVRPPGRAGRGPSLASLRKVIAAIERQP
jgi:hypothetical protein